MAPIPAPGSPQERDRDLELVGLPSRQRYNHFVAEAVEGCKLGGTPLRAQVFATLAMAEAQLLSSEIGITLTPPAPGPAPAVHPQRARV